jgi:hypothetical protein
MINTVTRRIDGWNLTISDNGLTGRNHINRNKLNYLANYRTCKIIGCGNQFRINRSSGLCNNHENHEHDLYLEVQDPLGVAVNAPAHKDIIDALIEWSSSRNFNLLPLFSCISFNTLGNVPDVSTLSGKVVHAGIVVPTLDFVFDALLLVVDNFFPTSNNSSHQPLKTAKGNIPAVVLAHIFIGLLVCEEANRGDRWFSRLVRKDESKTTQLGAAMPIAYFAARSFPWGVEMNNSARKLTL